MDITAVTASDLDAATDVRERALVDYALMSALFPGEPDRRCPDLAGLTALGALLAVRRFGRR